MHKENRNYWCEIKVTSEGVSASFYEETLEDGVVNLLDENYRTWAELGIETSPKISQSQFLVE